MKFTFRCHRTAQKKNEDRQWSRFESRYQIKFGSVRTLGLLIAVAIPSLVTGQDTTDYFRANCMNCHTIGGGRLTGPDLKDVTKRKGAEWLMGFMQNPKSVVDSGDAYAAKMVEESRGVVMPASPGMNRYRAEQIIKLIEAESKLEKSQFQGVKVSNKPFTVADRLAGRKIFNGTSKLTNGGASCIACHSMHDLSALGGGHLGPDLTRVFERLKGRKSLSAWLMAPATATMQPVFKSHPLEAGEIHSLVAYFEDSAKYGEADASTNRVAFLLLGLALATGTIFLFDFIWKGRFHSVRRPLVDGVVDSIHQHSNTKTSETVAVTSLGSNDSQPKRGDA